MKSWNVSFGIKDFSIKDFQGKSLQGLLKITYYHSVKGIITKIITKRICFDLSCYTIGVSLLNHVPCFVYDVKRLEQRFFVPAYDFHCLSSQLFQQCLKLFQHGQKVTCQLVPKFQAFNSHHILSLYSKFHHWRPKMFQNDSKLHILSSTQQQMSCITQTEIPQMTFCPRR